VTYAKFFGLAGTGRNYGIYSVLRGNHHYREYLLPLENLLCQFTA
jgi:hypothetical protein